MGKTLYEKVFERHTVRRLPSGQYQLLIGVQLIHEVTSPQAFGMMRDLGLKVAYPERNFAVVDHIIPTDDRSRPYADANAEKMMQHIEKNSRDFGIRFFGPDTKDQGVIHIVGPEEGLVQPGMTVVAGDSHTATHGAFGAIAFGIGTSQVGDVLATQTLAVSKLKVRRVVCNGMLPRGVFAKDVILHIIRKLGVNGGVGYAYEFAGSTFDDMSMDERMTVCNMAIEGGARVGYMLPDETTYEYLKGREYAPKGAAWDKAVEYWQSVRSDADAKYDDEVVFDATEMVPMVTWGITPAMTIGINEVIPSVNDFPANEQASVNEAYEYMGVKAGEFIRGTKIDVVFIGSCTNGRLSDFAAVAKMLRNRPFLKVAEGVKALIVPGSMEIARQIATLGYADIFRKAGFEVREAGCSMCLAMNADKLEGRQICASTSNRNFKGRQGSPTGRTILMSPVMAAAAACAGCVVDARQYFNMRTACSCFDCNLCGERN
ncbi:MAG: 3-isopropylmalate dehydratase large subunit [Candidatus Sumerlaeales bacterium]|nr:3-isopropylmalate dehydratase large subunit [Candidatus Sumerlaeales bacterium]